MLYEVFSIGLAFNSFGRPLVYLSHYLIFILFFYLHALCFLPFALRFRRDALWIVPLLVVLQVGAYIACQFVVSKLLSYLQVRQEIPHFYDGFVLRNIYRAGLYIGFATGYFYLRTYLRERQRAAALEEARLKAIISQQQTAHELVNVQNALLNAQINPHLLFNTLDFIYHDVRLHSATAADAIIRLSEMMRFAMETYRMDEHIQLADEIEQVENLLALYQLRAKEKINIDFTYDPLVPQLRFIPLVLLTLVENMFKHGDLRSLRPAKISLSLGDGHLKIVTCNAINPVKNVIGSRSGLKNCYTRLAFVYGGNVDFSHVTTDSGEFKVSISIPLNLMDSALHLQQP